MQKYEWKVPGNVCEELSPWILGKRVENQVWSWRKEIKGAERTKKEIEKGNSGINHEFIADAECSIKPNRLVVNKEAL